MRKRKFLGVFIAIFVLLISWCTYRLWPDDTAYAKQALTQIDLRRYYQISDEMGNNLFFSTISTDTLFQGVAWKAKDIHPIQKHTDGFWVNKNWLYPSCKGRIITAIADTMDLLVSAIKPSLFVAHQLKACQHEINKLKQQQHELRYYLRVHGVQDVGYDIVAKYATKIHLRKDTLKKAIALLLQLNKSKQINIRGIDCYTLTYNNTNGETGKKHCNVLAKDNHNGILLLRTAEGKTPHGANAITIAPWKVDRTFDAMAITSRFARPCPADFAQTGSMLFTPTYMDKGRFAGIKLQNGYCDSKQIKELIHLEQ